MCTQSGSPFVGCTKVIRKEKLKFEHLKFLNPFLSLTCPSVPPICPPSLAHLLPTPPPLSSSPPLSPSLPPLSLPSLSLSALSPSPLSLSPLSLPPLSLPPSPSLCVCSPFFRACRFRTPFKSHPRRSQSIFRLVSRIMFRFPMIYVSPFFHSTVHCIQLYKVSTSQVYPNGWSSDVLFNSEHLTYDRRDAEGRFWHLCHNLLAEYYPRWLTLGSIS